MYIMIITKYLLVYICVYSIDNLNIKLNIFLKLYLRYYLVVSNMQNKHCFFVNG